jgi:hypothetical protein
MQKYHGRYHSASLRLTGWDYGADAAYFITICTAGRVHCFGRIIDGNMIHSPLGQAAVACWHAIAHHFPIAIPDVFVVMPNHIHGIIVIDRSAGMGNTADAGADAGVAPHDIAAAADADAGVAPHDIAAAADAADAGVAPHDIAADAAADADAGVAPHDIAALQHPPQYASKHPAQPAPDGGAPPRTWHPNRFGPQSKNLASIVRGYKIGVTKYARIHRIPFTWQARYYDHVIRNPAAYNRICRYILDNPRRWWLKYR